MNIGVGRVTLRPPRKFCVAGVVGISTTHEQSEFRRALCSIIPQPPVGLSYIYSIAEPESGRVLYVGQTSMRPIHRAMGHLTAKTPLGDMLRELDQFPILRIESVCQTAEAHNEENRIMGKYGGFDDLFNKEPAVALPIAYSNRERFHAMDDTFPARLRLFLERLPEESAKRRPGRPPVPLAEKVFCSIMKAYSGLSSRQASDIIHVAAAERGEISKQWSFNTSSHFLVTELATTMLAFLLSEAKEEFGEPSESPPAPKAKNETAAANEKVCWLIAHLVARG